MKVLIVEDAAPVRALYARALRKRGIEVVEASDGSEGLAMLQQRDIALAVVDMNLPNMDGLEMLRRYRAREGADVPALMVSGGASQQLLDSGKALGISAWLIKPIQLSVLGSAVEKLLAGEGTRPSAPTLESSQ